MDDGFDAAEVRSDKNVCRSVVIEDAFDEMSASSVCRSVAKVLDVVLELDALSLEADDLMPVPW